MDKFILDGSINDKDFLIHILNNLPKEYNVFFGCAGESCHKSGNDALTIEVIREKLNHRYKRIKNKNETKREKEKALGACNKKFKERCHKCGRSKAK